MKNIIISGVSRGIGKSTAEKFLKKGWHVIGSSTSGNSQINHPEIEIYRLDLSDPASIQNFRNDVQNSHKRIDVLINNAGINMDKSEAITIETLRKTLEVNLIGLIDLTESLLPFIRDNGHVINLSSSLASLSEEEGSYAPSYSITKAAVNMYTRKLASRLASRNITVSSINPGWVKTDMGGLGAPRNPSEAAKDIYNLAVSKPDSGYFWHLGKKADW